VTDNKTASNRAFFCRYVFIQCRAAEDRTGKARDCGLMARKANEKGDKSFRFYPLNF
jgi:hypothetical protein